MLKIPITQGVGTGHTELSAFDAALHQAGIGDFNLIHLSSVIPTGSHIYLQQVPRIEHGKGDRLYVVYASKEVSVKDETAAAGLGWVMTKSKPSWGLFVEHEGNSEADVIDQIKQSLKTMTAYRPEEEWTDPMFQTASITCVDNPVCALVAAVYKQESW